MLHFRGSIRDLDIGGNCQSQKSCNFDHFFVSRLPAALEQCRGGARRTWRGTVSGVGLGSMVWRRYGAVGRYAHGAMERHRCSVANRHGTAWWDNTYPASWSGRVQWCGKARARRCGVVQVWCLERTRRCAMEWRGFGAVGCARCDVIGKCGVRWRQFFGFAAKMGKLQKVSKTS